MKKKNIVLFLSLISLSFNALAQEEDPTQINSIEQQFKALIERSNTYQDYKVIKISELSILQRDIRDSLGLLRTKISESEALLSEQAAMIQNNTQEINTLTQEVQLAQENTDSISFLGMPTEKSKYNFIMWSLISALLIISGFLYYRYKKTHVDTTDALKRLDETEEELENLRKRSLEREQKVRRELQDEINKNKNKS